MCCIVASINLYYTGYNAFIFYRIVGRNLITIFSWLYAYKNYLQASIWVVYKESFFACTKVRIVAIAIFILLFTLLEPTIVLWVAIL